MRPHTCWSETSVFRFLQRSVDGPLLLTNLVAKVELAARKISVTLKFLVRNLPERRAAIEDVVKVWSLISEAEFPR